jgi:protein-tyrosine phosphatase
LLAAQRGLAVECLRMGYPDGTIPSREHMSAILDAIDAALAAKQPIYIHCWGGHGRTGTTVSCYLIRHGATPQAAIDQLLALREPLPRHHYPFEGKQEDFVRSWQQGE